MAAGFVGRRQELAAIAAAVDDALAGRGRLVLLAGEPGVGKTRLADEAAALAAARGVPVLWGRCWEAGGAPAYWPWLEVLGGVVRRAQGMLDDEALQQTLGDGAAPLAALVPELRARLGELPAVQPPTAADGRFALWRAAGGLVRRVSAAGGLLVVLDDLHAADESSLLLLHFLARELKSMRLVVVGTYRDVEARLQPAMGELLTRIGREAENLALARLDSATAAAFLRQQAGALQPALEAQIVARTQGNPLFLEEMARLYADEGAAAIAAGALPHGVRDVIRQRLERVPAGARPLLEVAAVAGDEIEVALLAAASAETTAAVTAALDGAARAGVLVDRGAGRLRFVHALVREVVYRDIELQRRQALHGQVGAALERLRGAAAAPPLEELAHHALEAPPGEIARAVALATRAAAQELDLLAYEEAVALLTRAAAAVEAAGNPPALRAQVLLALARAQIRRGEGAAGRALCLEVSALGRALGEATLLAEAALAYGQVFVLAVIDPVLVGLLEEALAALPPGDSAFRVRLMARLAAALQPAARMTEPVAVGREAIAAARRLGDPETLLGALFASMSAFMDVVHARQRLALNLEIEQLATTLGDRERLLRTQARLAVDHMELGDLAAADARVDAFESLARELRAPWTLWRVPLFRSMRAMVGGRFHEAERLVAEAEQAAQQGDGEIERCCVFHREGLLRAWERHDDMRAFDVTARRARTALFRGPAWQATASALVAARLEDEGATRMHLELAPPEMRPPVDNPFAVFFTAEAAAFAGPDDVANKAYALLAPERDRNVMMGLSALLWEGPVARLLALLAARLGRWPDAAAHFQAAIARLEALDARPYLARTRYEYGRALLARGRAEDREQARALIGGARELAETLGQSGLARLAATRLAALGAGDAGVVTTSAAATIPVALTPDGEAWIVSHAGQRFRLKDSLGVRYLAKLVSAPDREIHVLELTRARDGDGADDEAAATVAGEAIDAGDAGEMLDRAARDSYRRRLEDLRDVLAEAESFGDGARAARAREEIDFLGAELGRAVGLGGRTRRAGGATERARSAVQRRIKNALERIAEQDPALAAYLTRTVRTGIHCVFHPGSPARA